MDDTLLLKDATLEQIVAHLAHRAGISGPLELLDGEKPMTAVANADALANGYYKGYDRPGFVALHFRPVSKKDDEAPDVMAATVGSAGDIFNALARTAQRIITSCPPKV